MDSFSISNVYLNKGKKTIDINPLPYKYCSFDCVFCPFGRTKVKTNDAKIIYETDKFIKNLELILKQKEIDIVFINPNGEALANYELKNIINIIKSYNIEVNLLTNGYILNDEKYRYTLKLCDKVIGELAVTNEEDFKKIQRPLDGYTLQIYIDNMTEFNKWFKGKFLIAITILKGYSDSEDDIDFFKRVIKKINPDDIILETPTRKKFKQAFGVDREKLKIIEQRLKAK